MEGQETRERVRDSMAVPVRGAESDAVLSLTQERGLGPGQQSHTASSLRLSSRDENEWLLLV